MRRAWVSSLAASIDALSPLRTLERGYVVARDDDGTTLSNVADFAPERPFALVVRDGTVRARTTSTEASPP
jgi:exodeoxyribonuclease VII large subunit